MANYRAVFTKPHTLLCVVHIENESQALRNSAIAFEAGADGIFLIDHNSGSDMLPPVYEAVRTQYPDQWIGLNYLGMFRQQAFQALSRQTKPSGLWLDNAGYQERADDPCEEVRKLREFQQHYKVEDSLLFGGVAFKYQRIVRDPALAAKLTAPLVDVVTTSGTGTGVAADIEKIKTMKEAIGSHPLAIASGITPENVHQYMPYIDCYLVATGISISHTELDPGKVRELVQALH